jgi:hypothetical protein
MRKCLIPRFGIGILVGAIAEVAVADFLARGTSLLALVISGAGAAIDEAEGRGKTLGKNREELNDFLERLES